VTQNKLLEIVSEIDDGVMFLDMIKLRSNNIKEVR